MKLRAYLMIFKQISWILPVIFLCSCAENLTHRGDELILRSKETVKLIDSSIGRLDHKIKSNESHYSDVEGLNAQFQEAAANASLKHRVEKLKILLIKLLESQQNVEEIIMKYKSKRELIPQEKKKLKAAFAELEQEIKYVHKVTEQETVSLPF